MGIAMHDPELYNETNKNQRKTTLEYLKQYSDKIKWNKIGDTAIDIGCADGSVSVIVKNFAPYTFKEFVACDISETMVKFASKRYADESILFKVLDIGGDLPENMIGKFNHVFSFFALHWVKNQEKAFRNVYNLMAEGGDCFMTLIGSTAIYSIYNILAHYPKWKSWLKEVDLFVSPYHDMEDPEIKVAEIMKKCGFKNIDVSCKLHTCYFDSVLQMKRMVQSVEPFHMPQEVYDEFIEDYVTVGKQIGVLHYNTDENSPYITYNYSLIVISASK